MPNSSRRFINGCVSGSADTAWITRELHAHGSSPAPFAISDTSMWYAPSSARSGAPPQLDRRAPVAASAPW
eukprot:2668695-Prymnesium_polylepis.2